MSIQAIPKYLYHVTSLANYQKIKNCGKLMKSLNEQLSGVYLLDKKNLLDKYSHVPCPIGQPIDALTSLFKRGNQKIEKSFVIVRVPTNNLVLNGKFRVKTQEDFFYIKRLLLEKQKGCNQIIKTRMLNEANNRNILRKNLSMNGMAKEKIDAFLNFISSKLHQGYKLEDVAKNKLDEKYAIEYIFNKNIDLKECQASFIDINKYLSINSSGKTIVDPQKLKTLFANF